MLNVWVDPSELLPTVKEVVVPVNSFTEVALQPKLRVAIVVARLIPALPAMAEASAVVPKVMPPALTFRPF